jgi:hypothetical protein
MCFSAFYGFSIMVDYIEMPSLFQSPLPSFRIFEHVASFMSANCKNTITFLEIIFTVEYVLTCLTCYFLFSIIAVIGFVYSSSL